MRLPAVLPTDLPRPALTLLAGDALFWLAEGLVFPYLLVYLQRRLHLELSVAGLVAGWVGLSGLVGVTLAGVLIDRRGARVAVTFGLLGAALGAAAFALSSNAPQALLAATAVGLGGAALQPATAALLAQLTPPDLRSVVFSLRYVGINVGVGAGGLLGGALVHLDRPATLSVLYAAQAAVLVAYALLTLRLRLPSAPVTVGATSWRGALAPLRDRAFLGPWLLMFLAMTFGVMQLSNGFAYVTLRVLDLPPRALGLALGVNAALIIALQMPVTRALSGRRRSDAMRTLFVCWAVAWLCVLAATLAAPALHAPLVVMAAALFALGELMLAPSLAPLPAALAPQGALGQYNAALSLANILGKTLAPLPASLLLERGPSTGFVTLMLLGCAAGMVTAMTSRRRLGAQTDLMPFPPSRRAR